MKNLSNRYFYEVHYSVDGNGNIHHWNGMYMQIERIDFTKQK